MRNAIMMQVMAFASRNNLEVTAIDIFPELSCATFKVEEFMSFRKIALCVTGQKDNEQLFLDDYLTYGGYSLFEKTSVAYVVQSGLFPITSSSREI